jgi:death-on-curing family protein
MIKKLSLVEVEYIAFSMAREYLSESQPIPDFVTRYPNVLESCIAAPFYTFDKKSIYKGVLEKAAVLLYSMIKNHPFQNGNKRIAITTLLVFLSNNGKWIKVDTKELYNFAVWVASSNSKIKEETIQAIIKFLKTYLVNLK